MRGKISARQLMLIVALSRISVIVIFLPVVTAADARQDAWIAAILAVGGGMALGAMAASLVRRFPGRTFACFARDVLGRVVGTGAALVLGLFFYALAVIRARQLALLVVTALFDRTPGWAIALTVLSAGLYGAFLGSDALGRAAEILITVIGASIVGGLALQFASGGVDFSLLLPILSRGIGPVLEATVVPIFWFATSALTVLVLTSVCAEPARAAGAVVKATLISGSVLVVVAATAIATFGPHEAQLQLSPVLSLARSVFLMGVAERLDVVLLNIWVLGVAFDIALFLFVSSLTLGDSLALGARSVLVVLAALGTVPVSLRSIDMFDIRRIFKPLPTGVTTLAIHVGLVGLTLLVALIRRKGEKGAKT